MVQTTDDPLSEALIAKLLEEDLRVLALAQEAERLQLDEVLHQSKSATSQNTRGARATRGRGRRVLSPPSHTSIEEVQTDSDLAHQLLLANVRLGSDAVFAQELQRAQDAAIVADQQAAQRLAAAELKLMVDLEFARKLQEMEDEAEDSDELEDMDDQDVEQVLGQDVLDRIMASDMNNKGKGKSSPSQPHPPFGKGKGIDSTAQQNDISSSSRDPQCGICMDPFQITYSPISASLSANSSGRLPFGLLLPCPKSHPYCLECIIGYIKSKIDPEGDGSGNRGTVVFPIKCPECPLPEWVDGIPDDIASRVLDKATLNIWHHQKLLDSLPKYYCPNPKCSELVQLHDDPEEPQATCPACSVSLCVPCRVLWHENLTCEEFQALPLDERSPEDQQALQLMTAKNWRRCPKCAVIVELTLGCNHITCRCGTHFCFKCGSLWDMKNYKCTRKPSCELWQEEMLLEEQQREREQQRRSPTPELPSPPRTPPVVYAPPTPSPEHQASRMWDGIPIYYPGDLTRQARFSLFDWIVEGGLRPGKHFFTQNMVGTLTCQYCNARLNSLGDLRGHLSQVNTHPVFACCGRFFKRWVDIKKHIQMGLVHANRVIRVTGDDDCEADDGLNWW